MGFLRDSGLPFNRCFSCNPSLARSYLTLWAWLLSFLPDGSWLKRHIGNNLRGTAWPELKLKPRRIELAPGVSALLVPTPGSLGFRSIYESRMGHEPGIPDFLAARMPRYDAVLEIGANVGIYTLLFSKCLIPLPLREGAGGGVNVKQIVGRPVAAELNSGGQGPPYTTPRIFAYEPSPKVFALLKEHLALNNCQNVTAFNCAVGATPGPIPFHENNLDYMKGSLSADVAALFPGASAQQTTVPAVSAEHIAPLLQPFKHLLFKIDVMGAEPEVLTGLRSLILDKKPDIVLGVWKQNQVGLNQLQFLREHYRLYKIEGHGLDERRQFTDESYCNYFLQPNS